ncbi:hypothetical protein BKI52_26295 [marine bacterium AO1-C]|nr:hypothetical protein BKI52_26295 [marine bacterium AO1-C]
MNYDICPIQYSNAAIQQYASFLGEVFHKPALFTPAYLNWQYNQNPAGKTIGFNAFSSDEALVAHYVVQPFQAMLQGKLTQGLLSYNTATHPQHSGQGLFTTLAQQTYEQAKMLGYEFVIGVSNENSTPGFVKKLGFQWVASLTVKIGAGKISFPKNAVYDYQKHWTAETLQWRLKQPHASYFIKKQKENLKVFTSAMGVRVALGGFADFPLEFKKTTDAIRFTKMWMGIDHQMSWRKGVFINLPQRLKPSPLNLIFKDLTGQGRQLDKTKIRFQALDFDAF